MIPPDSKVSMNSRAVIDACKPYERMKDFSEVVGDEPGTAGQGDRETGSLVFWIRLRGQVGWGSIPQPVLSPYLSFGD